MWNSESGTNSFFEDKNSLFEIFLKGTRISGIRGIEKIKIRFLSFYYFLN